MTERTALRLIYCISLPLIAVWMVVLRVLGVPDEIIVLGPMFVLVGGAIAIGQVTAHFGAARRNRRDDD